MREDQQKSMNGVHISVPDVIRKKRDGKELSEQEIQELVDRIVSPDISNRAHDSQIGAFLMATFLNGLTNAETSALTRAMTFSGYTFQWPVEWKGTVADKHSTGGVGDKVSLVLAPALAACGLRVPMISGRGLDFTGGTLDKLEAIPGFTVLLSKEDMQNLLATVGCCIVGQTEDIVPADKLLYAIRDITATVEREELIVASIISKKAAEGLDSLILDVKTGRGAMMKELEQSRSLARKMVNVGKSFGMNVTALVTDMDTPLGNTIGNALEVAEAIESLRNEGPDDLLTLTCITGGHLLFSTGKASSVNDGKSQILQVIKDGSALQKFQDMIVGQGVDNKVAQEICFGNIWKILPAAENILQITATSTGFVEDIDPLAIARGCHSLGCGRTKPGSPVLLEPGVILKKKLGDAVQSGEVLCEVHHGKILASDTHLNSLRNAIKVSPNQIKLRSIVVDVIE
ncbi:Thymidine phosphorylase [Orchesella cincta]|uniref:Thymidine phosphorylase n=1 Tax=Orchesella cincta TaxID=48709 RepID=A0A1D2NMM6_ORCCI|nr:Thymidine phosphorylase [Orchesella cincta]